MPRTAWITVVMALYGCVAANAWGQQAVAQMAPTAGNAAKGSVTFTQQGNDVRVSARLTGVPPGKHGFHIHEKGDCSAPDGMSAGGHFNPTGKPHGNPADADHHAGDMIMIEADASGNASLDTTLTGVAVGQGPADIVGKAVIVHKDPDDYKTQPTGNSGARIACGVIART